VIGVVLADEDTGRPAAPGPFVTAVGDHLSLGLERQVLAARALEARVAAEGQRLKSDLLAAVSHDLRTPLSTILFTLQSLRRFGDRHDADTRDSLLAAAEGETSRLASLVANLLDMSRLSADAVTVELRPTLMAELVADAMAQAGPTLAGREVAHSSTGALLCVDADPALARTAVANVLENAAKYSPEGSPLELRLATDAETATLEVLDRGPGFPPDAEAMFGRFIRGVEGDGRPPGTGLGLSIARGFMEAQGGRVDASERLDGPGARVRLTFRLSAAPPA
jgi:two-component system sensor histidine kinase KdpD